MQGNKVNNRCALYDVVGAVRVSRCLSDSAQGAFRLAESFAAPAACLNKPPVAANMSHRHGAEWCSAPPEVTFFRKLNRIAGEALIRV